jgi:hypothetical protein
MGEHVMSILLLLVLVLLSVYLFLILYCPLRRKKAKQIMKEIDVEKMKSLYDQAELTLSFLETIYKNDDWQQVNIGFMLIDIRYLKEIERVIALCKEEIVLNKKIILSKERIKPLEEIKEKYYQIILALEKIISLPKMI